METQKTSESSGIGSGVMTFLGVLRTDSKFRLNAGRVMRIASVALVIEVAMLGLARSDLADDANTYQVICFALFVAVLVIISALGWFIVRVIDEFVWFVVDRMNQ